MHEAFHSLTVAVLRILEMTYVDVGRQDTCEHDLHFRHFYGSLLQYICK